MSDKDKHNPKQEKDVKITFTPSGEKTVPFATKKPAEVVNAQLEKETSNNSLDINSNLGTFAEPNATEQTVPGAQTKSNVEIVKDLEHDDKTIDDTLTPQKHNKDQVIDFDKFSRVKPSRFNNRLAIKMDIWLKKRKYLIRVWIVILLVMIILLSMQISFIVVNSHILHSTTIPTPQNIPIIRSCGRIGIIFSYISMTLPAIPFIFMFTASIVGVNGIHSSRSFHMFLWSILLISVICLITSTTLSSIFISSYNSYIR